MEYGASSVLYGSGRIHQPIELDADARLNSLVDQKGLPDWLIGEHGDVLFLEFSLAVNRHQAKQRVASLAQADEQDLIYVGANRLLPLTDVEQPSKSRLVHSHWRKLQDTEEGGFPYMRFELPGHPHLSAEINTDQFEVPMGRVLKVSCC